MASRVPRSTVAAVSCFLVSCGGMTLHDPPNGATITTPTVAVRATWTDIQGSPDFALDGVDVTNLFTINTTSETATASLPVTPGPHTITFGANSYCSYCNPKYQRRVLSSTFTVTTSLSLSLAPTSIEVPRAGTATVTATVNRSANFTDAVTLTMTPVPGVTLSAMPIPGSNNTGPATLTAAPGASFGTTNATVTAAGTGGTPSATRSLAIKVSRRLGALTEVQPNISGAGVTTASSGGAHRVRITTGAQVGSNHSFAATFETTGGQNRGVAYFYQGGAGFCAGDSAGVVISNNATAFGQSSSHVYFISYFPNPNMLITLAAETDGGGNSVVQPRIFFSPDCSVAVMAHGNASGTSPYVVRAIDLLTGSVFGPGVEATTITPATLARVLYQNNQVQLEIVTDLRTERFPIP